MHEFMKYRDWVGPSHMTCVRHPVTHKEPFLCSVVATCETCCLNRNNKEVPIEVLDSLFTRIQTLNSQ